MKIIVLGAGQVGGSIARILAEEGNDITLVDENAAFLEHYKHGVDLRTLVGRASHPEVLERAEAGDADMLVALTREDEINMMACQIAHTLFHVPTKIARVRSIAYRKHQELFDKNHIPVDVVICPEEQTTNTIAKLIKYPNTRRVVEFADGELLMVATRVEQGSAMAHKRLSDIPEVIGNVDAQLVAIYRGDEGIIGVHNNEHLLPDDIVFFVAIEHALRVFTVAISNTEKPYQSIFIAGGGRIGTLLAKQLEDDYSVKIIDNNRGRSQALAETLNKAVVLHGDATASEIMIEENLDKMDVFCALTDRDESNIIAGILAKNKGVRKSMVLINKPDYQTVVKKTNIDLAFSPQQDAISTILQYIRKGDVVKAYSMHSGKAEAIEVVVHGDSASSRVVGRSIESLNLPTSLVVAAVIRNKQAIIVRDKSLTIESDDHLILFLDDKKTPAND